MLHSNLLQDDDILKYFYFPFFFFQKTAFYDYENHHQSHDMCNTIFWET